MIREKESGIRKLIEQFRPLLDLGDALKTVGSLEQLEAELKARIVVLEKQRDEAILKNAKELDAAQHAAKQVDREAANLLSAAKTQASEYLTAARQQAEALKQSEADKLDKAKARVTAAEAKAKALDAEASRMASDIAAKTKTLDDLDARLKDTQAALRKALGV